MTVAAYLLLGAGAGLAWFGALRWVSARLAAAAPSSGRRWLGLALVQVLRMLGMAILLVACARQGALPLCMTALGAVVTGKVWAAMARHASEAEA